MIGALLHNLTHRHVVVNRDGVGEFWTCSRRTGGKTVIVFRPDFGGADWHEVPPERNLLMRVASAASPWEAMAVLRGHADAVVRAEAAGEEATR